MTKSWAELEEKYKAGCSHCTHPLYAGIRCSVCGRWSDKLTPEEITELRQGKKAIAEYVQSNSAEILRYHRACQMALEALENHTAIKHPQQMHYRDSAIEALREVLGVRKCREKICERMADGYCARCHEGMY